MGSTDNSDRLLATWVSTVGVRSHGSKTSKKTARLCLKSPSQHGVKRAPHMWLGTTISERASSIICSHVFATSFEIGLHAILLGDEITEQGTFISTAGVRKRFSP